MNGTALIVIVVAASLGGYATACWIWPFTNCGACGGSGKRRSPSGKAFRLCRRCNATGRRLRFGRWIYNQFRRDR